ncbi:MAG TPA: hypothetical protein VG497_01925 [Kribbella sp.]|nr:hypothetical protein [Kribbella sp.]
MPGNTPRYSIPYAVLGDQPHGPNQQKAIADAVEAALGTVDDYAHRAAIGGEYREAAANSLTGGGAIRLTFATAVKAANGITWNGTNTWTITEAGVYACYAQCRKSIAAASDSMSITGTTYSDGTLLIPGTSTTGYGDVHVSGARYFDVGTNLCAWYWSGSATALSAFATRPAVFSVWRVA